jgi:EmrB/QacA subfamily drug resistance transporter
MIAFLLNKKIMADTTAFPIDRKPYRWIVFSVAFAVFMVRLDGYIVNISMPAIARHFHVGTSEASWVVLSYLLVMTGSMLIFGKLGDRIGLKKIFISGYVCFTIGSLLCGLSPNIYVLDVARGIQGIGGAMMMTGAFAVISHYLPEAITGWAFGLCSLANSLGIMVGAPLGGIITGFFSWQWIFLINIPVGVAAVLIARKALPDEKPAGTTTEKRHFDVIGSTLSFVALSTLVYGLSMGQEWRWDSPVILAALAIAALASGAFIYREMTCADPILDFKLFKNRDFVFVILTTLMAVMLLAGGNFLLPFYLELVKGLETEKVGFVILIYSLVYMPIAPFSGRLSDRINPRIICASAMFMGLIACLVFAFSLSMPGLAPAVIYLILLAVTYSLFFPSNNHLVMSLASHESQGAASGLYSTAINVSMVLGICLFESVFSHALPEGVSLKHASPDQAASIAGLLTDAFQIAFIVGSAVCLLAFVFSLFTGRKSSELDK